MRVLAGHRRRVFNTVWSPLRANALASGSDDTTVRVWDVTSGESIVSNTSTLPVRCSFWCRTNAVAPYRCYEVTLTACALWCGAPRFPTCC